MLDHYHGKMYSFITPIFLLKKFFYTYENLKNFLTISEKKKKINKYTSFIKVTFKYMQLKNPYREINDWNIDSK